MLTTPETETLVVKTGKRMREIRIAKSLKIREAAELLGTTVQTVSRLENAEMTLSVRWIEKFCTALDVMPSALFDDAAFNEQVSRDAVCAKVLALRFEMQRTTGCMAEFLKANGWPS